MNINSLCSLKAGLPDVMVTVKEENSVLCAEPFITVNHETDHLYGQIEVC